MRQHRLTIGKHRKEIFICQAPGDGPIRIFNGDFLSDADHLLAYLWTCVFIAIRIVSGSARDLCFFGLHAPCPLLLP
jgi:hypothetical protein